MDFGQDEVPEYLLNSFRELSTPEVSDAVVRVVNGYGNPGERLDQLWPVLDEKTANRVAYHQREKAARAAQLYDEFGIGTNVDMLRGLTLQSSAESESVMQRLEELDLPTLVMTGIHGHNVDPRRTAMIARAITGADLVRLTDSAHMPDLEEPGRYVDALLHFLED